LFVKVFEDEIVGTTTPSTAKTPADERDNVVSEALPNSKLPTPNAVDVEEVIPETGKLVQFVNVPELGVPKTGVVNVGLVKVLFVKVCEPVSVVTVLSMFKVIELPEAVEVNPVPPAIFKVSPKLIVVTVEVSSENLIFGFVIEIVPDEVIVPPERPVPAVIERTVPPPAGVPGSYRPDVLLNINCWPFVGAVPATSDKSFILEFSVSISFQAPESAKNAFAVPVVVANIPA